MNDSALIRAADWLSLATLPKSPPITDDNATVTGDKFTRGRLAQDARALPKDQRAISLSITEPP